MLWIQRTYWINSAFLCQPFLFLYLRMKPIESEICLEKGEDTQGSDHPSQTLGSLLWCLTASTYCRFHWIPDIWHGSENKQYNEATSSKEGGWMHWLGWGKVQYLTVINRMPPPTHHIKDVVRLVHFAVDTVQDRVVCTYKHRWSMHGVLQTQDYILQLWHYRTFTTAWAGRTLLNTEKYAEQSSLPFQLWKLLQSNPALT